MLVIVAPLCAPLACGQTSTSVTNFGAVADAIMRTDGAMTAGSNVLTSASATFNSSDTGKYIQVIGAGPGGTSHSDGAMALGSAALSSGSGTFAATDVGRGIVVVGAAAGGANLVTSIKAYTSANSVTLNAAAGSVVAAAQYFYGAMTLEGTIQSVQGATAITLSTAASGTITGAMYAYGTDNHLAFQTAVDSVGAGGGGTVRVPQPASCPSGAACGYVIKASDQMTSDAPGAVKIRYNNVSLIGDAPQTNLFCRGAWAAYFNSVKFTGQVGTIRGFCITIGDAGGPRGAAGNAVSNVTISKLHLYGMTNGNTYNNSFIPTAPPLTTTGDGWDETHKGIYLRDNSAFSNITIDSIVIQDFKGENIYSGGSVVTGMVISNSTMANFNGNAISMLAADLQVLNNTMTNGSNSAVENSTVGATSAALVRQLYQSNTISLMAREGITVVGVDSNVAAGSIQILNNYFDTIAQTHPSGAETAIFIAAQSGGGNIAPQNVTISGNTCHDCLSFGVLETSGTTQVSANTFIVDNYNCSDFVTFTFPMTNFTISSNSGYATANALSRGLALGSVYMINPGYATGNFAWNQVTLQNNNWSFSGRPHYTFITTSGPGWALVTNKNLIWQGDTCQGCTYADINHGMVNLASGTRIEPYGGIIHVTGNTASTTATIDASKEQDGAEVQIVNVGSQPVVFASDSNLSLPSPITLPGGVNSSVTFTYSAAIGKFTSSSTVAVSVTPQTGTLTPGKTLQFSATVTGTTNQQVTWTVAPAGAGGVSASGLYTAPATVTVQQTVTVQATSAADTTASASAIVTLNPPSVTIASVTATGGTPQTATVNTSFATPLTATVKDASSNPVSGVTVTFAAPSSGASALFGGSTAATAVTNSSGVATAPALTANSQAGGYTVTATVSGVASAASFSLTNRAGAAASVTSSGGTPQSATINTSFATLTATVKDANGNPVSGVTVTFAAPSTGPSVTFGSSASTTTVTNTSGIATATTLTANGQAGSYTVTASVSGVVSAPTFSLTNNAALIGSLSGSGNSATTTVNLTAEGGADWVHWGDASLTRKAGVAAQISNYTMVGSVAPTAYFNDPRPSSWSDGTPTASSTNNLNGLYIGGVQNGFLFTASADTTTRTVTVHVGGWNSGGTLTAHLSDGSASDFVDTTAVVGTQYDRNYTLVYRAGSAGQTLMVTWVVTSGIGNVTLDGAALGGSGVSATGGTPQSTTVNTVFTTPLQATVADANGNPIGGVAVTFTAPGGGPSAAFGGSATASAVTNSSGVATAPALTANGQTGSYTLVASVSGVGATAAFSLTNSAGPTGGSLSGLGDSATTTVNLTVEGGADWVHWGDASRSRKASVTPQISNYKVVGSLAPATYNNDPRPSSWTDGAPAASSANNRSGLFVGGLQNGFAFTVPADATVRTLKVHVGGWSSGGTLTAILSDGSAANFVDTTAVVSGQYDRNYTLVYRAASVGQTLTVTWVTRSGGGNVTFDGAALSVGQ